MRNYKAAAWFFLAGVLTRIPFRGEMLYNRDAVEFALALDKFDVALHRPHPPGYFLYVMAGRLLSAVSGDANFVFTAISVFFSGLAVAALYVLAERIFGGRTAFLAALLALTSPLYWYYGSVSATYIVEAFFSAIIGWLCFRILRGEHGLLAVSALLLALAAGVRQSTLFFMLPLWVYCIWGASARQKAAAFAALFAGLFAWSLPMLEMTGGYERYMAAAEELNRFAVAPHSVFSGGWNAAGFFHALTGSVLLGAGLGVSFIVFAAAAGMRGVGLTENKVFLLLWFLPAALFLLFIHNHPGTPGLVVVLMPPVFVAAARGLEAASGRLFGASPNQALRTLALFVIAFNIYTFFFLDTQVSLKGLRRSEKYLKAFVQAVRGSLPPSETVILSGDYIYAGPMQFIYYLPEYATYIMDESMDKQGGRRRVLWGRGRNIYISNAVCLDAGVRRFVSPYPEEFSGKFGKAEGIRTLYAGGEAVAVYGDIKYAPLIYDMKFYRPRRAEGRPCR